MATDNPFLYGLLSLTAHDVNLFLVVAVLVVTFAALITKREGGQ